MMKPVEGMAGKDARAQACFQAAWHDHGGKLIGQCGRRRCFHSDAALDRGALEAGATGMVFAD